MLLAAHTPTIACVRSAIGRGFCMASLMGVTGARQVAAAREMGER